MKAVVFDGTLRVCDMPRPVPPADEVLIRVVKAGICTTDLEITRGYVPGFNGIPGHEFIGIVAQAPDQSLLGKRVTAEINCACGDCEFCREGMQRHCPRRTVIGIMNRNGAFAEYIAVPSVNIVPVPDEITDDNALFIEPLAAALEILEQTTIKPQENVLMIGDGKLAILIAYVLNSIDCNLTVVGKHADKMKFLETIAIPTIHLKYFTPSLFDVVIEASGNPSAFALGLKCVKPRGTMIIKSTYAGSFSFNPSSVVVDEKTIIGSRCGRLPQAVRFLQTTRLNLEPLISDEFTMENAVKAFERAADHEALKVILKN